MDHNDANPQREDFKGPARQHVYQREVFYKGQNIIEQGQTGARQAYYIEEGRAQVVVGDESSEVVVATLGPGSIVGEMALIVPDERSATVRALEDCTVTVITMTDMEKRIRKMDKAMAALMKLFVNRLKEADRSILRYYKDLAEFRGRVHEVADKVSRSISPQDRENFRKEVTPLLEQLEKLIRRYQPEPGKKGKK